MTSPVMLRVLTLDICQEFEIIFTNIQSAEIFINIQYDEMFNRDSYFYPISLPGILESPALAFWNIPIHRLGNIGNIPEILVKNIQPANI